MDLQTSLLCLGLVIVSALLIWIISTLGTRGQSYEEVVAESRRLAAQRGLLDDSAKVKKAQQQQSKKNKKAGKKVKEKQAKEQQAAASNSEPDSDGLVESGPEEDSPLAHGKPSHVEFVEPAVVVEPEMIPPKPVKAKKRGKEPKVKPILLNKDDPSCVSDVSTPPSPTLAEPANHFEQIHPKDEFELLHLSEKDKSDVATKDKRDIKAAKHGKAGKGVAKQQEQGGKQKEEVVTKPQEKQQEQTPQEPPKEQRKGKNKSIEKSDSVEKPVEVQVVTPSASVSQPANLTTDKILKQAYPLEVSAPSSGTPTPPLVQGSSSTDCTVTNGPTQQVQGKKKKRDVQLQHLTMGGDGLNVNLLVKVLTDAPLSRSEIQILTDCLLNKQNGPLPEHSEWSEGPKDPMQRLKRQLAEKEKALTDEQEAHLALKAKVKELRASLNTEHSRRSQIEEASNALRSESCLYVTRFQRASEEIILLRQQIHQLQSKMSAEVDFAAQRSQMEMQIQVLSENKTTLNSALNALKVEMTEMRNAHAAITNELHMTREEIMKNQHHSQNLSRQLEETNKINKDLESQRLNAVRSEQKVEQELMKANEKVKVLSDTSEEEKQHLKKLNHQKTMDYEREQQERDRHNQMLSNEIMKLKKEKEDLNTLVAEMKEQLASQPTPNGTATPDKDESENVEKAVAAACSELEAKHSQQMDTLQRQLDQHRDKNNDLRTKNWKVMEALQAAEEKVKKLSNSTKSADDDSLREALCAARLAEQSQTKEVLLRLYPDLEVQGASHQEWLQNFVEKTRQLKQNHAPVATSEDEAKLKDMEKQNLHLQTLVDKYKRVIDDTEGVLSRLQSNVTEEEQRWAKQLLEKQQEVDNLKNNSIAQLQNRVESLEKELEGERNRMREPSPLVPHIGKPSFTDMAGVEKLKEENARLTEIVEKLHGTAQSLNGPSQGGSGEK